VTGIVLVTRKIRESGLRLLREAGVQVRVCETRRDQGPDHRQLVREVRDCDVLLSLLTERVDAEVLSANPDLRGVANYAVGVDNIDLVAATRAGIPVSNTPDVLSETTADLAWALVLAVSRRVVEGDAYMRAGRYQSWAPDLLLGQDVSPGGDGRRKTLGIVGFGRIGRAVARRAQGFDMRVLATGSGGPAPVESTGLATWVELPELLRESDFVSLHTPLTSATEHLIGAAEFEQMRANAYLINTARGPIVDESALVRALREGRIAGAGLDVYEAEPAMAPGLAELENVVLLPHLGSASRGTRDQMAVLAANNALAMLRGDRAPNCVNPAVYEDRQ
jgi:glyoxylate reductase